MSKKTSSHMPTPFGRYHLYDCIGKGGMAEIYRAKLLGPSGFEKTVAIKRLLPYWSSNADFVAMLVDEAKVLTHLLHPNIVHIFELATHDTQLYIAMEYVPGKNLKECLSLAQARGEPLPLSIVLYSLRETLRALDYAHTRKTEAGQPLHLVHRDISPQNILVSLDGDIKLTDFGIAKALGRSSEQTETGVLKGKFAYMSPEQAAGEDVDLRSDLFTLGLILFECLTQTRFFDGKNDLSILESVKRYETVRLVSRISMLELPLQAILKRALEPRREDRYASAAEFLADIEKQLDRYRFDDAAREQWIDPREYFRDLIESAAPLSGCDDDHTTTAPKTLKTRVLFPVRREDAPLDSGEFVHDPVLSMPIPSKRRRIDAIWRRVRMPLGFGASFVVTFSLGMWLLNTYLPSPASLENPDKPIVSGSSVPSSEVFENKPPVSVKRLTGLDKPTMAFGALDAGFSALFASSQTLNPVPKPSQDKGDSQKKPTSVLGKGKLRISAKPWGLVQVTGHSRDVEAPFLRQLPEGRYPVSVTYNGHVLRTLAIVNAGQETVCKANFASQDMTCE